MPTSPKPSKSRNDANPGDDLNAELADATTAPPNLPTYTKAHPHVHNPDAQRKLINRLARVEGHVRGIRSMIEQQQPCPDVLLQIAAVRGALDRVARLILDDHITECIAHAAESGDIEVELAELRKALDRFIS